MRQGMRGLGLLVVVLSAMATAGVASAVVLPTGLTGESLVGGPGAITGTCNADGSGNFHWTVSGVAAGPYPGTFTASGTASFTAVVFGPVTVTESFVIDSPVGHVTGTKSGTFDFGAQCEATGFFSIFAIGTLVPYTATITTPTGSGQDSGTSVLNVGGTAGTGVVAYNETFTSLAVVPLKPQTKEDCKNGGYANYPGYSNQGQCIQYVNTGK
jgi:hypothetical protein